MNPLHGPSLELCKKLKEVGFNQKIKLKWYQGFGKGHLGKSPNKYDTIVCSCPSVMEMLDVINTATLPTSGNGWTSQLEMSGKYVAIVESGTFRGHYSEEVIKSFLSDTLPNALAEMIIWLVKNKHLSFNK